MKNGLLRRATRAERGGERPRGRGHKHKAVFGVTRHRSCFDVGILLTYYKHSNLEKIELSWDVMGKRIQKKPNKLSISGSRGRSPD